MESPIHLTDLSKELLSRILYHGMDGSYYERDERPAGEDIAGFLRQESDVITEAQIGRIAKYYQLWSHELLELLSDEKECMEWLGRRALPLDDPW